jgi:hypothetical protein
MKTIALPSKSLVRVHRHTAKYLNNVRFSFEGYAEQNDPKQKIVFYVVNKRAFTNRADALKFAYDSAKAKGGV